MQMCISKSIELSMSQTQNIVHADVYLQVYVYNIQVYVYDIEARMSPGICVYRYENNYGAKIHIRA